MLLYFKVPFWIQETNYLVSKAACLLERTVRLLSSFFLWVELKAYQRKREKSGDANTLQQIYFHKPTAAEIRMYSPVNPFS